MAQLCCAQLDRLVVSERRIVLGQKQHVGGGARLVGDRGADPRKRPSGSAAREQDREPRDTAQTPPITPWT